MIGENLGSEETTAGTGFGGWAQHNAFGVIVDETYGRYGMSFGQDTGSNPLSGSATWAGLMTGLDTEREKGLGGDASLSFDFSDATVDVAFMNIHDQDLERIADMHWTNVAASGGDFYQAGTGRGDMIRGTFYGPAHAEVGGVFERGDVIGAFGATRD